MINSRESKLLRDTFQCQDRIYSSIGVVLEIMKDSTSASLIDPLTLIIKAEDSLESQSFANEISTAINENQEDDKKIVFKRVELENDSKPVTRAYMDHFEKKLDKESKSSKKFAIQLTVIGTLGGIGGGVALYHIFKIP
ncbi:MAG: putative membrane protein [Cenarchaeum symbiont of Oopsacas minuta]|nr:putative membrane protein [Cenarchaeum symbiont of Oopsacas minuta]